MVGHDQGSLLAAFGALIRPDMFPRLTLIFGGFGGVPSFPFNTANGSSAPHPEYTHAVLEVEYANLDPPRRGNQDYWASPEADRDMKHVSPGMTNFFPRLLLYQKCRFPRQQESAAFASSAYRKEAAEQNARVIPGAIITRDRPHEAGLRFAGAGIEHGTPRLVAEQPR
jgi:pimeloyl-ACP methyl ester carboxylesterase